MSGFFVDLRCPNTPYPDDPSAECRCRMQGPSLESVLASVDAGIPYKDVRYCTHCKALFYVTIPGRTGPVNYELIPRGTTLPFISETDVFGLVEVTGRKVKRKAKS